MPHGLTLTRAGKEPEWLGAMFSDVPIGPGDEFDRPTAGGGGFGDPLERDPDKVLEDVIDDYVSVGRAAKDYGVIIIPVDPEICEYRLDLEATKAEREKIRAARLDWFKKPPEDVAEDYRNGKIDMLDAVRRHAVILDWETGELLPNSTAQFREMFERRTVAAWS